MRIRIAALVLSVVVAWLGSVPSFARPDDQIPPLGGIEEYVSDLTSRRARVMAALGPDALLVLWAAPRRVYSGDVDYEYRQDSNFLYLTGLNEEGGVLVLVPGSRTRREFLFAPQGTATQELWSGHVPTAEELRRQTGIQNVHLQKGTEALEAFFAALVAGEPFGSPADDPGIEFGAFLNAVRDGSARLGVLDRAVPSAGGPRTDTLAPDSAVARGLAIQRAHPAFQLFNATEILTRLRQIKTPYEQRVLRRSVTISAEAHVEGMKVTRPGRWEYEVEAAIEYWFLKHGALSWGYPSIVGSGPNATTLHYLKSTRQMQAGDLLLVDAAGNYQGLTGDITRTYPVTGRFSAEQRDIYELVLRAQEAGKAAAMPGSRAAAITTAAREVFRAGLEELGLIVPESGGLSASAQVALWFPHSATHGIGIDVHDPLGALDPGAAFVIEPGLYIRPDRLEGIPRTPENIALIDRLRPSVERYRDIGVRIEDSFLMTPAGPESLSDKAPRQVRDIERIVGTGP